MHAATDIVAPGEVLLETYRVEGVIGGGGMGVVLAATSLKRGERVAIKVLQPDKAQREEVVKRFLLEANAVLKIESPHVARVFDVGRLPSGAPYMVMEYLEGMSLAALLRERGPLPPSTAADYLLQACEALAEAHLSGIVHRDLKPANLFLCQEVDGSESIKVLDFGVSKMRSTTGMSLGMTLPTEMVGSPFYMAPEQMRCSRDVDRRCDIWAMGVTLYELCTGKRPFQGDVLPALMMAVLQRQPPPLRELLPDAPPTLEEVVERCLRKEPEDRYADVAGLAAALAPLAPDHAQRILDRISRVSRATPISSLPPRPSDTEIPALGAGRLTWIVGTLAVLAVAAAGLIHFAR
jgi:serine/threonine-protein kinase